MTQTNLEQQFADNVQKLAKPGADIQKDMNISKLIRLAAAIELFNLASAELDKAKALMFYNKDKGAPHPIVEGLMTAIGGRSLPYLREEQIEELHMVVGLAGEAGELQEQIYKELFLFQAKDRENKVEELGDIEFYLSGFRNVIGVSRNTALEANIKKLSARYHTGGYTDAQAVARADKQVDKPVSPEDCIRTDETKE